MYNLKEPAKDPAYFNFTSHTDLNRLAKAVKKDIVIYYAHDDGFKMFEIYHDFPFPLFWIWLFLLIVFTNFGKSKLFWSIFARAISTKRK